MEAGHTAPDEGDSGSAVWTKKEDEQEGGNEQETRYIQVAIVHGGVTQYDKTGKEYPERMCLRGKENVCNNVGTKITPQTIDFIKSSIITSTSC